MSSISQSGRFRHGAARIGGLGRMAAARIAAFPLAARLVDLADLIEAAWRRLAGPVRALARRNRLGVALGWRAGAAAAGLGLAALGATALGSGGSQAHLASPEGAIPAGEPVSAASLPGGAEWVRIAQPIALFGLEAAALDRQETRYEARRSADSRRRIDLLRFGSLGGAQPHLALEITLDQATRLAPRPFVVALVRTTADQSLAIERSAAPIPIATKFGMVETADVTLGDGEASRGCIAFRFDGTGEPLGFTGWWCGAQGRPADRQQLTCLIDRIELLSAGEDKALRAAFLRTEAQRRPGCTVPRLAASGRKSSWLDADAKAPALRATSKR